ncbi:mandelate racemase/muconate lactonizing enzyme family protein [Azospirillum sp. ST 5-10]|uniref:mandelate racemase/muconate lactonizing enzyme family protein n=1 Tax=unclassified Azospirillum TaxID=2630922 RepID=UPI003F49D465
MPIARITIHRLRLPLRQPYKLAFGPVAAYDTFLAEVEDDDGRRGWGEATPLAGYTEETPDHAARFLAEAPAALSGLAAADARARLAGHAHRHPFSVTALVTALEMLEDHPLLRVAEAAEVPLLAILNGADAEEIEARLGEGYRTLKVKVGFDADADAARVGRIQETVAGRAALRLDANQGYDRAAAVRFLDALAPRGIELVEQLCAAGDWESAQAVAAAGRTRGIPVMLDESIYGAADVERAARLGAATHVKLKLMKCGGLSACATLLERIRALGLVPVLGNGVAADVGCWMEACLARTLVANAGEMNGFLKPRESVLRSPLPTAGPAVRLEPGWRPEPDAERLARHRVPLTQQGKDAA